MKNNRIKLNTINEAIDDIKSGKVIIVVDDENGNVLNFAFNVEVNDTEPPTITRMPDDITVSAEAGICTSNVDWELPEGNDNCAPSTLVSSHQAGIDFPVGTTLVTYTATDIHGNITKETFNITVVDEEFPTISEHYFGVSGSFEKTI